ncbi:MAG: hypothetical protein MUQ71_04935, partial [Flavobacteriaceae bacterium]|nr:hypothetical protein [Flavobacteriaceae bacterium]
MLILFFKVAITYSQTDPLELKIIQKDSLTVDQSKENKVLDSIPQNKPMLLDLINYNASDSVKIDQKANKIRLYNNAVLT